MTKAMYNRLAALIMCPILDLNLESIAFFLLSEVKYNKSSFNFVLMENCFHCDERTNEEMFGECGV